MWRHFDHGRIIEIIRQLYVHVLIVHFGDSDFPDTKQDSHLRYRSSHPKMLFKLGNPKNFAKFTEEKTCVFL